MVSEFIEKAWNAYKRNFWTILGARILEFVIVGVVALIILAIAFAMFLQNLMTIIGSGMTKDCMTKDCMLNGASSQVWIKLLLSSIPAILVAVIGIAIALILFVEFEAGLVKIYADSLKGKAKLDDLFYALKNKFWSVLGANLMVLLIALVLVAVLIFPAVILMVVSPLAGIPLLLIGIIIIFLVMLLFFVVNQAIVLGNKGAAESIDVSIRTIKANYFSALALALIFFAINLILQLMGISPFLIIPMLISLLVVAPLQMISFTAFYNENKQYAKPVKRSAAAKRRKK